MYNYLLQRIISKFFSLIKIYVEGKADQRFLEDFLAQYI